MNRILVSALLLSLSLSSCKMLKNRGSSDRNDGQIVSKTSSAWTPVRPKGMVPIPSGSFVLGQTDYDFTKTNDAPVKTVTVTGFFMDEETLGFDPMNPSADGDGIGAYAYVSGSADGEGTPYDEYLKNSNTGRDGQSLDAKKLNWKQRLEWDKYKYPDVDYAEVMEGLYYPPEERMNGERRIDYSYVTVDQTAAAKKKGTFRVDFRKEFSLNIYPDTTVWVRDFNYSYNDPMHQDYFWHKAYANYPVVGVNWNQATAFCDFRTRYHNTALNNKKKRGSQVKVISYRLPTEIEWEYAAKGGLENAPYPWGGPYLTDDRGCYLANFKPKRGDYLEINDGKKTGYMYTAPVKTFKANGYGLYDMAGNVAEWTSSPYNRSSYTMSSSLNPSITMSGEVNRSVRGGSWKDVGYLLMVSSRDWEHKDSARSFIGFRTVQSFPEGSKVNFRKTK